MSDVRSKDGTPVVSDFASGKGTPLVVDQSTGECYVMTDEDDIFNITGAVLNVKGYGATGDGTTDDTTSITATITAASHGDTIYFPRGSYLISSTITVNKRLRLQGAMAYGGLPGDVSGSIIKGTGITILKMEEPFIMDCLVIHETAGHASAIGVDINDGDNGVVKWAIKNCAIIGYKASGFGTLGIGIRGIFGLEGVVENCTVEGWLNGVKWDESNGSLSNSNDVRGCKIRQNTIGILLQNIDNAHVFGNTIEGNSTGIKLITGRLTAVANHFENNLGDRREIHATDGNVVSVGNGYYGGTSTDKDIYIESGAGLHTSIGDTLNFGIKHAGTGMFTLNMPLLTPTVSGTGPIARVDGNGILGLQGLSSTDMSLTGYSSLQVDSHVALAEVGDPSGTANKGKLYVKDNGAGKSQLCVIFGSGATQVIATEP